MTNRYTRKRGHQPVADERAYIQACQNDAEAKVNRVEALEAREDDRFRHLLHEFHTNQNMELTMRDLMVPERAPDGTMDTMLHSRDLAAIRREGINGPGRVLTNENALYEAGTHSEYLSEANDFNFGSAAMMGPYCLTSRQPQRKQILNEYGQPVQQRVMPQQTRPTMTRNAGPARQATNTAHQWVVRREIAEAKDGSDVPVWLISCQGTPLKVDKMFRIEQVAHRIARILNETNNIAHPKVLALMGAHDKRMKLLREVRMLERAVKTDRSKASMLQQRRSELADLDTKLGI